MKTRVSTLIVLLLLLSVQLLAEKPGDRVQYGHSFVVAADETVGDAVCIGCSIQVLGNVTGDVVAVGGSLDISGDVKGDTVAVGGSINLGPAATVGGDVVTVGGSLSRDPGAQVSGEVVSTPGGHFAVGGLGALILICFLSTVGIGILLSLICYAIAGPRRIETVARTLQEKTGLSLLSGLGVLVAASVLVVLFRYMRPVTPLLVMVLGLALFVACVIGYTGLSFWMGKKTGRTGPLAAVVLGALIITVIQAVPILGFLAAILFLLFALGSAVISGFGTSPDWMERRAGSPPTSAAAGQR